MQVGDKAKGSPEGMCIRSQSVPIGPIEGQKFDLHERQQWFRHPHSSNESTISEMGRVVPTSYTHTCNNGVKLGVPQAILVANGGGEVGIGNLFVLIRGRILELFHSK